jgi:hypothetical protein
MEAIENNKIKEVREMVEGNKNIVNRKAKVRIFYIFFF